ncbi:hypothetical protein BD410DRAFT_449631 [Rickenella mellea]|uniref:DUF6533 domain-containing protein n=1 Tax=Rickenella mellea TaxID=50990 RepID=A0A4Y7PVI7_9AGAM|nr:hypothetical protein BD410DRAFT_449631 [Rickenella mellea]
MSDPSPDAVAVIAEISQLLFLSRVMIAGAAFVFYDYALTLSTEISEIWNSKFSGAQALFFLMRYSYMVFTVFFCMINLIPNPSKTVGVEGLPLISRLGVSCLKLVYMAF